jgi:hypothetical protein
MKMSVGVCIVLGAWNSNAEDFYARCKVTEAGYAWGSPKVRVESSAFTGSYLLQPFAGQDNVILAAALAAISSGQEVYIQLIGVNPSDRSVIGYVGMINVLSN